MIFRNPSHVRSMRPLVSAATLTAVVALGGCSGSSSSSSSSTGMKEIAVNTATRFDATTSTQPGAAIVTFPSGLQAKASLNAVAISSASGQVSLPTTLAGQFKAPTNAVLAPLSLGLNSSGVTPSAVVPSASNKPTVTFTLRYGSTKIPLTNDTAFAGSVIASVPKSQVNNIRIDITQGKTTKTVDLLGRNAH